MEKRWPCFTLVFFVILGCSSGSSNSRIAKRPEILNTSKQESSADAIAALESVAQTFEVGDLSDAQLKQVAQEVRKDKNARSAVDAITEALKGDNIQVKYSPATGKRYSANMEYCPETGVKLLPVE